MGRTRRRKWKKRGKQILSGSGDIAYSLAQFGSGAAQIAEGGMKISEIRRGDTKSYYRGAKGARSVYAGARQIRASTRSYGRGRRKVGGQKGHPFYGNQYTKVSRYKRGKGGFGRSKSAAQRARARRRR
jgi:hypothetical protein